MSKQPTKPPLSKKGQLQLEARFLRAAITSNLKEVAACIEAGVNVNAYIRGGSNALHVAAERGDVPLGVTLAVSPDLNYNAKSDTGLTSLTLACLIRKRRFVSFLLKNNADPNMQDHFGKTALHYICRMDAMDLAFELFKRCDDVDVNKKDCYGATPLLVALLEGKSLHMAKFLIKHGATTEVGPQRGMPLFLENANACNSPQHVEMARFLVQLGVDVDTMDPVTKKTALHVVAVTGYYPLMLQLLAWGADVEKRDVSGRTASEIALMHGNYSICRVLRKEERKLRGGDENIKLCCDVANTD